MKHSETEAKTAKQILRDAGLRATAARAAVLRILGTKRVPMSRAEVEVVDDLSDFGFDQSALCRCLNEIADTGLAVRLDLGDHT